MNSTNRFHQLKQTKAPILTCYLPFSDPLIFKGIEEVYADCGVDVIELGLPAETPYADGPTTANSMKRAFKNNKDLVGLKEQVQLIRDNCPRTGTVVMGYEESMDISHILMESGPNIDGILCLSREVNLQKISWSYDGYPIYRILFLSHDLTDDELEVAINSQGYIMLAATSGKTGVRSTISDNSRQIAKIKAAGIETPVLLGIGISNPDHAAQAIAMGADGVIIGSACVEHALEGKAALTSFLTSIRRALNDA